jgi:hypothetical protein
MLKMNTSRECRDLHPEKCARCPRHRRAQIVDFITPADHEGQQMCTMQAVNSSHADAAPAASGSPARWIAATRSRRPSAPESRSRTAPAESSGYWLAVVSRSTASTPADSSRQKIVTVADAEGTQQYLEKRRLVGTHDNVAMNVALQVNRGQQVVRCPARTVLLNRLPETRFSQRGSSSSNFALTWAGDRLASNGKGAVSAHDQ